MTCGEVMTPNPKCCLPSDSALRAARLMKIEDVGSLPVCSSGDSRRLVGIITDRDLALNVVAEGHDSNSTQIQSIMTREPYTCREDEDLQTALERWGRARQDRAARKIPPTAGGISSVSVRSPWTA